ncbi:DUF5789 family protein [Salinigranum halophilum]|uniref:DUF5789 family protein n=1 Tax=Salinigranum halophilum TaxID=2565931 RepID=UPI0010A8DAA1|nr:hypothetical protein [Salinigranum halophilum]
MGVRPPQQDGSDADHIEFGIAALEPHIDERIDYPATADEIVETVGDVQVSYDASGGTVALSEIIEAAPARRFESKRDLLDTLHPVFEEYRAATSNSLVGRLRGLLPF